MTGSERDELAREAEGIEASTGKRLMKWRKTALTRKQAYLRAVFSSRRFANTLFYARYTQTKGAYIDLMVYSAARAILYKAQATMRRS